MTKTATPDLDKTDAPDDLSAIVPDEVRVDVNGISCTVKRLKTREFFSLLRVLTSGLGGSIGNVQLSVGDEEAMAGELITLAMIAIPNAMPEFQVFLADVVKPVDPEKNAEVARYLHDNPEIEEMIDIFEAVAEQEKEDLASLVGKVRAMWGRLTTLYRPKTSPTG